MNLLINCLTTVTSSKKSVATIASKKYSKSKGYYYVSFKVKAVKAGKTTVKAYAKYGKKAASWKITVKEATPAPAEDLAITASQTGSATITVKANKALTKEDAITVTRGTTAQTVVVALSEDGMTATLTLATAITASDYTVTVTPKDTTVKPVTATVKGAKSVLTSLKFASDKLVLLNNVGTQGSVVVNGYDQFGEKVAISDSNTTFYATGATKQSYTSDTGVLVLAAQNSAYPFVVGNTVAVTAVYNNGTTVLQQAATLKVSAAAYVKSLEFGELATSNTALQGKKVTISNFADGSYYYPIKATNQYDQALSATDLTNMKTAGTLIVSPTNAGYAYIDSFATLKDGTVIAKVKKGIPALIPTTVPLTLVSVGGGTFTKNLVIEDNPYIAALNVQIPEAYSNKKVEVTVSATDQNGEAYDFYNTAKATGNKITFGDTNSLTGSSSKIEATTGTFSMVKDTTKKTVTFYYTCANANATAIKDNIVVTTAKPAVSALSVTVNPAGTIDKVQGLASGVATTLSSGDTLSLSNKKNIVFLDSYGAAMDNAPVTYAQSATGLTGGNYYYSLSVDGTADDNGDVAWISNTTSNVVSHACTVTLYKADSATAWTKVNSVDFTLKCNPSSTTYTATLSSSSDLLYVATGSADTATLKVVRDIDGTKTTLTNHTGSSAVGANEYTLTDDLGLISDNNTIDATKAGNLADNTSGTDVIYVKDNNGDVIANVAMKYSNAAKVATAASWTKNDGAADASDTVTTSATAATFTGGVFSMTGDTSKLALSVVDQYGLVMTDATISINGTDGVSKFVGAGAENTVTITSADGKFTKTVKVINNGTV